VDLLPPALQRRLFQGVRARPPPSPARQKAAVDELQRFGLTPAAGAAVELPDVTDFLPALRGDSVSQHLRAEAQRQAAPYLEQLTALLAAPTPPAPRHWCPDPGWTRYAPGQPPCTVEHPLEPCMVLDTEVCVSADPRAVMAVAVTSKAWYCWLSPHLLQAEPFPLPFTPATMIPLGSDASPRLVIGHNVSYDRIRLADEYRMAGSGTRFLDTMSLHIAVAGMTSSQRMMKMAAKNLSKEELKHKPAWLARTSANGLKDVHEFWTKSPTSLNKETRNAFVTDSLAELRADLGNLVTYCAGDVAATLEVAGALVPRFLGRCPHPATLAGMLAMSTGFLPTSSCWEDFQAAAEAAYRHLEAAMMEGVQVEARAAVLAAQDFSYQRDPWLWDMEWGVASLRTIKGRIMAEVHRGDAELQAAFPAGFPTWYQELADTDRQGRPFLNLSAGKRAVPKLLRLTWLGFPLHHHKTLKWGYLVPTRDARQVLEQVEVGNISTAFPLHEFLEFVHQDKVLEPVVGMEEAEVHLNTMDDFPEKPQRKAKPRAKVQEVGEDIGIPGVRFVKLPHKNGAKFNVGNPLSKDFLASVGEGGALASCKPAMAEALLRGNMSLAYWKSCQARVKEQVKVEFPGMSGGWGAILPAMVVCGTITRRAVEKTWLTASNAKADRIGSELKSYIRAPPGFHMVGADVDQQELWLASVMGDAGAGGHGATALGWMTLQGEKAQGTDLHSKTAAAAQVTRDQAKVLNYGRIYGAGEPFARTLLQQFNASLGEEEAARRARHMYLQTKGARGYQLNARGLWLQGMLGGVAPAVASRQELWRLGKVAVVLGRLVVEGEGGEGEHCLTTEGQRLYEELRPELEEEWVVGEEELGELLRHVVRQHSGVVERSLADYETRESLVHQTIWSGGSESHTFNRLEAVAMSPAPVTPVLGAGITQALDTKLIGRNFLTSRINWVVQSSAVDYLHLLLVSVQWLFGELEVEGRFVISIHDEVRFLVRSEDRWRAALALHLANLLVRAEVCAQLGLDNLPASGAFFSSVDVDTVMRKEPSADCVTPSNPRGLEAGHGVPRGEGLDIRGVLEKVRAEGWPRTRPDNTLDSTLKEMVVQKTLISELSKKTTKVKRRSPQKRSSVGMVEGGLEEQLRSRWKTQGETEV